MLCAFIEILPDRESPTSLSGRFDTCKQQDSVEKPCMRALFQVSAKGTDSARQAKALNIHTSVSSNVIALKRHETSASEVLCGLCCLTSTHGDPNGISGRPSSLRASCRPTQRRRLWNGVPKASNSKGRRRNEAVDGIASRRRPVTSPDYNLSK